MKTLNHVPRLFIATLLLVTLSASLMAGNTATKPAQDIRAAIQNQLKFPDLTSRECCTGTVSVEFCVNSEGKIDIKKISSDNQRIVDEVKRQLANIDCKEVKCPSFQRYSIQISFKLVS